MALVAPIENGKVQETASQSSLKRNTANSSGLDKESFLQLLVAQMQYQDPLEPTSNTEYVSQYAQFSQVEEIQNMASSMDLLRASSLVGQEVYIKTTSESGVTNYIQGKVDYVVYENNKPYLSINESLYSMDDLDSVVDKSYQSAYDDAYAFTVKLNKLTPLDNLSLSDRETVEGLKKAFDDMSDYEKTFVTKENQVKINTYAEKMAELVKAAENKE